MTTISDRDNHEEGRVNFGAWLQSIMAGKICQRTQCLLVGVYIEVVHTTADQEAE